MCDSLNGARYMQYLAALSASMSFAACTMYISWTSPSLSVLTSEESPLGRKISNEEGSWIVSTVSFGMMAGCLLFYWMVDVLGRKNTIIISNVPLLVGWLVILFTKSVFVICLVRFVTGMAQGTLVTTCSIYNAEIADKDIRGKLGSYLNLIRILGSFVVLVVGPFVSYASLLLICTVPPLICVISLAFMPESPYYLVKKGRTVEAKRAIETLCSRDVDVEHKEKMLQEIESTVLHDMRNKTTVWEFFSNAEYRRAIYVMAGLKSLQLLCGIIAIEGYMQYIIEQTGSSISPQYSSIIFGAIQIPAALLSAELVDRMGRKPLMFVSSAGCALALAAEGLYFYLQNVSGVDVSSLSWLPTSGLVLYIIMTPVGVFSLPPVILGEIFPTNIKGIAISVASFYGGLLGFVTSKLFSPVSEAFGLHVSLWIFSGFCILGCLFVVFRLPETKGKTFNEIQIKLNKNLRA